LQFHCGERGLRVVVQRTGRIFGALVVSVLGSAGLAAPARATTGPLTFVIPSSVPHTSLATCAAAPDATTAFNNWLFGSNGPIAQIRAENPPVTGNVIKLGLQQCYEVEGTISISGIYGTTFYGNGSTIRTLHDASGPNSPHILLQGDARVTVQGLRIWGSGGSYNPNLSFQAAFKIYGGNHVTIQKNSADDVNGDYVWIQANRDNVPGTITIQNNNFGLMGVGTFGAGRQELAIDDVNNVTVTGNYFGHGSRSAIDIEPPGVTNVNYTHYVDTVTITNNQFGPVHNFWFANKGANAPVNNVTITDNTTAEGQPLNVWSENPGPNANRGNYDIERNSTGGQSSVCAGVGLTAAQPPPPSATMLFAGARSQLNPDGTTTKLLKGPGVTGLKIWNNAQDMGGNSSCAEFVYTHGSSNVSIGNNYLPNGRRVGVFDAQSPPVCEGGDYYVVANPPLYAPDEPNLNATLCPSFSG
jgi:hypothetical protein